MIHIKSYEYDADADSRSQKSVSEADSLLYPPSSFLSSSSLLPSSLSCKETDQCQTCEKSHDLVEFKTLELEKLIAVKGIIRREAIVF